MGRQLAVGTGVGRRRRGTRWDEALGGHELRVAVVPGGPGRDHRDTLRGAEPDAVGVTEEVAPQQTERPSRDSFS